MNGNFQDWLVRKTKSLTTEITTQLLALATSSLGLVAALAWHDAVPAVFKEYFPAASGIAPKFFYAFLLSVLIILLTINLARIADFAKNGRRRA